MSIRPPFTSLATVPTAIEDDRVPVVLGAQACQFTDAGACADEVSAGALATLNDRQVLSDIPKAMRRAARPTRPY